MRCTVFTHTEQLVVISVYQSFLRFTELFSWYILSILLFCLLFLLFVVLYIRYVLCKDIIFTVLYINAIIHFSFFHTLWFSIFTLISLLKGYFKKRLDRFFEQNPNQPLLRNNASPILTHAYEKALQSNNMISLFERLGICPFNNLSSSIGAYLNMVCFH